MKKVKRRSNCPISFGLDLFGDKWSLPIIRDLLFEGKVYYRDFLESEEKIATNILADRLERLEQNGLITKRESPLNRSKYIYTLAEKGQVLLPVLIEIIKWSAKYDPDTTADKSFVERAYKDPEGLMKEILSNIIRLTD